MNTGRLETNEHGILGPKPNPPAMKRNAKERLEALGRLNGKKGEEYGRFEKIGEVLSTFFPKGVVLVGSEQFTKFVLFSLIALKMDRLSNYVPRKLHADSMDDAAVYLMMLRAFDEDGIT